MKFPRKLFSKTNFGLCVVFPFLENARFSCRKQNKRHYKTSRTQLLAGKAPAIVSQKCRGLSEQQPTHFVSRHGVRRRRITALIRRRNALHLNWLIKQFSDCQDTQTISFQHEKSSAKNAQQSCELQTLSLNHLPGPSTIYPAEKAFDLFL